MYTGVVESTHDPLELGRLQVRFVGVHDGSLSSIKTEDLPWAQVMMPLSASGIAGIGSSISITEGTWVVGFFQDPEKQQPIILGALQGVSSQLESIDKSKGFRDPNNTHPRRNGPDTPLSATRQYQKSVPFLRKKASHVEEVPIAQKAHLASLGDEKPVHNSPWNQPDPEEYIKPAYPKNSVIEKESGIVQEYDSTPNHERISTYHPSGSYVEHLPDGSRITHIHQKDFEVVVSDRNVLIKGDCSITTEGDYRLKVGGDCIFDVDGSMSAVIRGGRSQQIGLNDRLECLGDVSQNVEGSFKQRVGSDRTVKILEDDRLLVKNDLITTATKQFHTAKNVNVTAIDEVLLACPDHVTVKGRDIMLSTNFDGEDGQIFSMTQLDTRGTGNFMFYGDVFSSINGDVVSLHYHTHDQPVDSRGDTQADTFAPIPAISGPGIMPVGDSEYQDIIGSSQSQLFSSREVDIKYLVTDFDSDWAVSDYSDSGPDQALPLFPY